MSLVNEKIKEQLKEFSRKVGPAAILPAVVTSVNESDCIVNIIFSDDSETDARLRSVVKNGNRTVQFPKTGSVVLVGSIENSEEYVVLAVEEIDKEVIVIGNTTVQIDEAGVLISKEEDSLKGILLLIIEAVNKIVVLQGTNPDRVKLGQASNKVNNLLQ